MARLADAAPAPTWQRAVMDRTALSRRLLARLVCVVVAVGLAGGCNGDGPHEGGQGVPRLGGVAVPAGDQFWVIGGAAAGPGGPAFSIQTAFAADERGRVTRTV